MTVRADTPGSKDPGPGRRLGVDVGTVRIGVAVSDGEASIATPVETVSRDTEAGAPDGADIDRLAELAAGYRAVEVIVGLPTTLKGRGSASVAQAELVAGRLAERVSAPVRFFDERLSTVVATQALHASGVSERRGRAVVDQAAAVEILQGWLDARRRELDRRRAPGRVGPAELARRARKRKGEAEKP
ncbi:Holliday junction resolvase RuvX [Corynebacterium otitidis]|nr:Holliday junction resolvase RuvX [Corynebacterium otitidis]EJZ82341.1 RNAse H-fold protein YqgF [Corynebacterium otitidis ATCC 51513]KKO84205.1 Holliday junction resolvase [Corynebacterium otitidis]